MKRAILTIAGLVAMLAWAVAAQAQGSYQVQAGDQLAVEVLDDQSLNRTVLVTPDGRISFPLAGTVLAEGRTLGQIENALSSALAPSFANRPTVFVAVTGLARDDENADEEDEILTVYIVGEVNSPGPKAVLSGTTVLQLLSQSGGFTPFAATRRLQLRRADATGRERVFNINYRAIARGAEILSAPPLQEGDVLLVPERRLFE